VEFLYFTIGGHITYSMIRHAVAMAAKQMKVTTDFALNFQNAFSLAV
jgi:hypothetical protein